MVHPTTPECIINDLEKYTAENHIESLSDIVGTLKLWGA
jgi:dihydroorotate dehydrogenase